MNALLITMIMLCPPMDYPNELHLSDIQGVDSLPICHVEDCSDQPNQIGLWLDNDTGNWYYSGGERSYLIVDDTVR
jgi:hypothetical protein